MVHCHCLAVNDAALRRVLEEQPGATILDAIRTCGAGTDCGGCRPALKLLLARELEGQPVSISA